MLSDELQMLIDAAIADGEITEKELAVLHKRAQAEGVDLDEFDMLLKAQLSKCKVSNDLKQTQNNVVTDLMAEIEALVNAYPQAADPDDEDHDTVDDSLADKIKSKLEHLVSSFIMPTEKRLLLLFLSHAKAYKRKNALNSTMPTDEILGSAFRKRYKDAIQIVQKQYPGDPEFVNLIGEDALPKDQREKKGFFGKLFGK